MLEQTRQLLTRLPLPLNDAALTSLAVTTLLVALLVSAWIVFLVAKHLLVRSVAAAARRTKTDWDNRMVEHRVFAWCAHLAPGIVLYQFAPSVFAGQADVAAAVRGAAQIYLIVAALLALDALLNAALEIYQTFENAKEVPLKGAVQVAKIVIYLAAVIVIMATLLGKSPLVLLGGMGVVASVLMLVFKDAILGLVAGIQLSTNRMLSKGDWLEMPSYGADGDVIDIALTTVKVQNWDKTITTVPTYALISNSFKNWRGMSESGGRRIKRSIMIDINTIKLCSEEMISRYSKIRYISEYVERTRSELDLWNKQEGVDAGDVRANLVNSRRMTNVGTFRAYLLAYLKNHPGIHQNMTLLVRHQAPTTQGLPIEIYCFSNDTAWETYESVQADIFDHILAIAREFDLGIFQSPSGRDVERLIGSPAAPSF